MAFFKEFENLKIQLEEINLATDNFADKNVIGKGGFGTVYKGEIKGRGMGAIKRLDSRFGQGNSEFWKEIMTLSRYTNENLVSLLGYCDEDGEKILIYEYASRGSLDRYLSATTLTWRQRLKICLAAARGLCYLHDPKEAHQRILHRDIKSSNILLDENWNAKISDLGLSKIGPANQQHTVLVTNVVGTHGYVDPLYMETYMLTKESDVYSFGVVLFEVLCGRLCFGFSNSQWETLVPTWKQSYEQKKLKEIIFQDLLQQMDVSSLERFSDIAYLCLQKSRVERPTMALVVKKLESALEFQEIYEEPTMPMDSEEVIKTAVPAVIYGSKEELHLLLSNGVLVNRGKTWVSSNKKGEYCEMVSASACVIPSEDDGSGFLSTYHNSRYNTRFAEGTYLAFRGKFKAHVRARFLSPRITYTVNLVFNFYGTEQNTSKQSFLSLKYKLEGKRKSSISYLADEREDGWMMVELYQFTSDTTNFDLEIQFEGLRYKSLLVEGIEFRPLEKVEQEALEDEKVDMQPLSDLDIDWEQKLPNDHEDIIKWSKDSMKWTSKKELYFIFCKGFLINNGEEWFSLAKNGKKCLMLSTGGVSPKSNHKFRSSLESRFNGRHGYASRGEWSIVCTIEPRFLSCQTTYACYLVYNITENHAEFETPIKVKDKRSRLKNSFFADMWYRLFHLKDSCVGDILVKLFELEGSHVPDKWFIYLLSRPQTPVIRPKVDQNTHNPQNIPKIKGLPQLRNDGRMEVQVWEFQTNTTTEMISMHIQLTAKLFWMLDGLIFHGIEFKPL